MALRVAKVVDPARSDHPRRRVAEFLREQTLARIDEIQEEAKAQFEERMYNVDDEWGDVEMSVDSLELAGEPEVIEADEDSATLEVQFTGNSRRTSRSTIRPPAFTTARRRT